MSLRRRTLYPETAGISWHNGVWDTDLEVRPRWEDGTPAHTVKKFGIVNRYDLREEFPILTMRRTFFKTCIDELLWIWQKKSNNIHDLHGHIWDQLGRRNRLHRQGLRLSAGRSSTSIPEGEFDQVDRVLYDLKHNPACRRIMTNHLQLCRTCTRWPCTPAPTP